MSLIPAVDTNNWVACSDELWQGDEAYDSVSVAGLTFAKCSDGRFTNDRCMERAGKYFILLDGVLLNKNDLLSEYHTTTVANLLATMIDREGYAKTFRSLRGPFEGCIFDIDAKTLTIFVNQTGDTAAFVYSSDNDLLASNSFDLMQRLLTNRGIKTTFDERAAHMMLTYGFMVDETTFSEEIKRVLPGRYLTVDLGRSNSSVSNEYWRLEYRPNADLTLEQAADFMQKIFMAAASRCFDKDLEYGYSDHLIDISGGMDSRVVNLAGKKLGHERITNITYSETGTEEAAASIAASVQLGNDLLFYPLDSARSAMEPELNLRLNSGTSLYDGITGGRPVLERLNFARHGLEHTGQAGDAVFVSYAESSHERPADPNLGKYSLLHEYPDLLDASTFQNEEIMGMQTRGFLGTNSSHLLRRHYTYAVSPFLDVDLLEAAFTIPLEHRFGHRAYEVWLRKYHPEALLAPSTRKLASEKEEDLAKASRSVLARYWHWGLFRLKRDFYKLVRAPEKEELGTYQLRPGHWYDTISAYRATVDEKQAALAALNISSELREDLRKSFEAERIGYRIIDKTLAATVVTMHQLYFS